MTFSAGGTRRPARRWRARSSSAARTRPPRPGVSPDSPHPAQQEARDRSRCPLGRRRRRSPGGGRGVGRGGLLAGLHEWCRGAGKKGRPEIHRRDSRLGDDAVEQVVAAARYMRQQNPYSPASYLMLRGLRWGELRASGKIHRPDQLEAPPREFRQRFKRLGTRPNNWHRTVLEMTETAQGTSLQPAHGSTCNDTSYRSMLRPGRLITKPIRCGRAVGELRALLREVHPTLPNGHP